MPSRRISVVVEGKVRPPLYPLPLISSATSQWHGFVLEQHRMPSCVEFPSSMKFPGHLICLSEAGDPVSMHWREDGHQRYAKIFAGQLAVRSSQDLIACRQQGACTLSSLLVSDELMQQVCAETRGARPVELVPKPDVSDATLRHLMLALVADLRAGCPAGRIFGESIAHTIAAYAAQRYGVFPSSFPKHRGLPSDRLQKVIDYVHSNLSGALSVSEIAQVAYISPYHFGKLFKQSTGQSLHQYVLDRRIQLAKLLLAKTELSLVDIASMVGMANQSHFTTVFRHRTGASPGVYRACIKNRKRSMPECSS